MDSQIKQGDTVRLKSGGPVMTVSVRNPSVNGGFFCQWFDGAELKTGSFHMDSLERATPEKAK